MITYGTESDTSAAFSAALSQKYQTPIRVDDNNAEIFTGPLSPQEINILAEQYGVPQSILDVCGSCEFYKALGYEDQNGATGGVSNRCTLYYDSDANKVIAVDPNFTVRHQKTAADNGHCSVASYNREPKQTPPKRGFLNRITLGVLGN